MIKFNCFPDEFAPGYEGRLARVGNHASIEKLRTHLVARFGLPRNASRIEGISHAAGLDVSEFVRLHTVLAFRHFVVPSRIVTDHLRDYLHAPSTLIRGMTPTSETRFCRNCVAEDLDFHRFSYWRRSHHLRGIDWCSKHNTALTKIRGSGSFLDLPNELVNDRHRDEEAANLEEWPTLTRLMSIALGILDMDKPVRLDMISRALTSHVQAKGIRLSEAGRALHCLAHAQYPADWLRQYLPEAGWSQTYQGYCVFGGVLSFKLRLLPQMAYIAAIALTCDSSDEALRLIADAQRLPGEIEAPC